MSGVQNLVENYKRFGKKIWLTEFACADQNYDVSLGHSQLWDGLELWGFFGCYLGFGVLIVGIMGVKSKTKEKGKMFFYQVFDPMVLGELC